MYMYVSLPMILPNKYKCLDNLLNFFLFYFRICECGLHGQENTNAQKPVLGHPENGGTEEKRGIALEQRQHPRGSQQ